MKIIGCFLFSALFCANLMPCAAHAQGVAPGMYGVGEIIVEYAQFNDPKASNSCNLSRESIASVLSGAFAGTTVPVVAVADAKPPARGVARIQLIPEIASFVDENLECISWISLSAESRIDVVIPPVGAPRSVTAVYWRQRVGVSSGQSVHADRVGEILKKMADQFSQQYRLDQPAALQK